MQYKSGHRQRLREKFLENGEDSLHDYEILELFLFKSIPRKDVRVLAKKLIKEFGCLYNVLNATKFELLKIDGIGESTAFDLIVAKALLTAAEKSLAKEEKVFIGEYPALIKYLKSILSHKTHEEMWVVTYDAKGQLIKAQMIFRGSVNSSAISTREIIKTILLQQAVGVILCHNHPSGDPLPSPHDVNFTMSFQQALMTIDQELTLIDHIIIGKNKHYSFQMHGKI